MKRRTVFAVSSVVIVTAIVASYMASKARADGVPSTPMVYSGYVEDANGSPVNGSQSMSLSLFSDGTIATSACTGFAGTVSVSNGHFAIALAADCTTAARSNPSLWVELTVNANKLPRVQLGVVPFALEARRASEAAGSLKTTLDQSQSDINALSSSTAALGTQYTALSSSTAVLGTQYAALSSSNAALGTQFSALSSSTAALSQQTRIDRVATTLAGTCLASSGGVFLTQTHVNETCAAACTAIGGSAPCKWGYASVGNYTGDNWTAAIHSYGNECTLASAQAYWCCCGTSGAAMAPIYYR